MALYMSSFLPADVLQKVFLTSEKPFICKFPAIRINLPETLLEQIETETIKEKTKTDVNSRH